VRLLPFRPFGVPIEAVPLALELDDDASFRAWLLSIARGARVGGTGGAKPPGQE
jgi:hypothetical protein